MTTRLSNRLPRKEQSRATHKLGDDFIKTYRQVRSWPETARLHKVMCSSGPNVGLVYRIAMQDYEPTKPETRKLLGLPETPDRCPTCQRRMRQSAVTGPIKKNWRCLMDIPLARLAWMFDNREVVQ